MSLPIFLPYGMVSIYGVGSVTGNTGIVQPPPFLWGNVDSISQYGISWTEVGSSVLFDDSKVICRLAYAADNTSYTLIMESNIVVREVPLP